MWVIDQEPRQQPMLKHVSTDELRLTVSNLGFDRGGQPVVRGLDFELTSGQALQVFGRNGAGKSSFLNVLAGLSRSAEGRVTWQIGSMEPSSKPSPGSLVFLGHQSPIKPQFSVVEAMAFWGRIYGASQEQCSEAIDRVGLVAQRHQEGYTLSAGQRKRLELARALVSKRRVWLFDEPTAALDNKGKDLVRELLIEHLSAGGCTVIATHERLEIPCYELWLEDS